MEQNVAGTPVPEEQPFMRPTVALLVTGRRRRLRERLVRDRLRTLRVDDVDDLRSVATDGLADVVIVELSTTAVERPELVPRLGEAARVIVVAGPAGPEGEAVRVNALRAGADDAMPEHVGYEELLWRVQALLRRIRPQAQAQLLSIGVLEVDGDRHEARLRGERLELTPIEFQLLQVLAQAPDVVQPRERLLSTVWRWPDADRARSRTLDLHASRLRQKLARDGDEFVVAVRRVGYRLLP